MVPCWNGRRERILNCFKLLELLIKVQYHRNFDIKIQMNVLAHPVHPRLSHWSCNCGMLRRSGTTWMPAAGRLVFLLKSSREIHCPSSAPNSLNDAKIVCKCIFFFFFLYKVALNTCKYFTSPWMSEILFSVFMSYVWVPSMVAWACRAWAPSQNKCNILLS